jgi:hypothetical protein
MNQEQKPAVVVPRGPLAIVVTTLLARLKEQVEQFAYQARHQRDIRTSHRRHTVLWKHLDPGQSLLAHAASRPNLLPRDLLVATVGRYFVAALEENLVQDQVIHNLQEDAAKCRYAGAVLLLLVEPGEQTEQLTALNEKFSAAVKLLSEQLLTEVQTEVVAQLADLLSGAAQTSQQEQLRSALLEFCHREIEVAVTASGYHKVPTRHEPNPHVLVEDAEKALLAVEQQLDAAISNYLPYLRLAALGNQIDHAIGCALVAYEFACERSACWEDGATVSGALSFLRGCLPALAVTEALPEELPVEGDERCLYYRARGQYTKLADDVTKREESFARDRDRHHELQARCLRAIARARSLATRKLGLRSSF